MTRVQKALIRGGVTAAAAFALLIPVTVSPGQGVEANQACADGACCREFNSVCYGPEGSLLHHYQTSGRCSLAPTTEINGEDNN